MGDSGHENYAFFACSFLNSNNNIKFRLPNFPWPFDKSEIQPGNSGLDYSVGTYLGTKGGLSSTSSRYVFWSLLIAKREQGLSILGLTLVDFPESESALVSIKYTLYPISVTMSVLRMTSDAHL